MYVDMKRIREVMEKDKNSIIICGHVHWQSKIEYRENMIGIIFRRNIGHWLMMSCVVGR